MAQTDGHRKLETESAQWADSVKTSIKFIVCTDDMNNHIPHLFILYVRLLEKVQRNIYLYQYGPDFEQPT